LDTRDLLYFLSVAIFFIVLTKFNIKKQSRWSSLLLS
jgi:hypothetical protein